MVAKQKCLYLDNYYCVCWKPTIFFWIIVCCTRVLYILYSTTRRDITKQLLHRETRLTRSVFAKVTMKIDRTFHGTVRIFCINFPALFSIWVHCTRRTITHLDIARLALVSDIPCAYRYRLLFPFAAFRPSPYTYVSLSLFFSLSHYVNLLLPFSLFLICLDVLSSTFSANKMHARSRFYEARRNFVY